MFTVFAFLAILIACFGLIGLSAYNIPHKYKRGRYPQGGASVQICGVYSFERFPLLVAIAFVIAAPVAWFIMHNWSRRRMLSASILAKTDTPNIFSRLSIFKDSACTLIKQVAVVIARSAFCLPCLPYIMLGQKFFTKSRSSSAVYKHDLCLCCHRFVMRSNKSPNRDADLFT